MDVRFALIPATTSLEQLEAKAQTRDLAPNLVAVRGDQIVGWLTRERMLAAAARGQDPSAPMGRLACQDYAIVDKEMSLLEVVAQMRNQEAEVALVTSQGETEAVARLRGIITKELVADYVGRATDWYHR